MPYAAASEDGAFSWQNLGRKGGATSQDPWVSDPLKAIPNPTDQVVYFSFADVLIFFAFFCLLLYGIWLIYLGVRDKNGSKKSEGGFCWLLAAVLMFIDNHYATIEHYMTQSASSSLGQLQQFKLGIATNAYKMFGSSVPDGNNPVLQALLITLVLASPVVFVACIVKDSRRRKAIEKQVLVDEIDELTARVEELEKQVVEESAQDESGEAGEIEFDSLKDDILYYIVSEDGEEIGFVIAEDGQEVERYYEGVDPDEYRWVDGKP